MLGGLNPFLVVVALVIAWIVWSVWREGSKIDALIKCKRQERIDKLPSPEQLRSLMLGDETLACTVATQVGTFLDTEYLFGNEGYECIQALVSAVKLAEPPSIRVAAIDALCLLQWRWDDPFGAQNLEVAKEVVGQLVPRLNVEPDPTVQLHLIVALRRHGHASYEASKSALQLCARDAVPIVALQATEALAAWDDPSD